MPYYYGFTFKDVAPIFRRAVENSYCPDCYRLLWPRVPPSDWHRRLLAIEPVTRAAEARALTCCQCRRPLAP